MLVANRMAHRAGTPKPIVARLNAESNAAIALPQVKKKLTALGSEVVGGIVSLVSYRRAMTLHDGPGFRPSPE